MEAKGLTVTILQGLLSLALFLAVDLAAAGLDVGRLHWTGRLSASVYVLAYIGYAAGCAVMMWAMRVNRFFSSVVRIQTERGHRVIDTGPYAWVRHPGYVGALLYVPCTALTLGSLWALLPAAAISAALIVRTHLEDETLQSELPGYRDYAARVRWRLVPGLW
jgi:protein-S-isoprenylcysteine O-methyltransferase Ste14